MTSSSKFYFRSKLHIFLSIRSLDTGKEFSDNLYHSFKGEGFKIRRFDDEIERDENFKSILSTAMSADDEIELDGNFKSILSTGMSAIEGIERSENFKSIWSTAMSADDDIEWDENFKFNLSIAISRSNVSIIVLSKNYANSTACLYAIQEILNRRRMSDHLILPVFYEVDPREVRAQAENLDFGKNKVMVAEVKEWSAALKEVASMAGVVARKQSDGCEAMFIQEIVDVFKSKLVGMQFDVDDHLELDKKNLKRKLEYLSGQENDINAGISIVERRPWKRRKKEFEVWLRDVHQLKDDGQKIVGKSNVFVEKIQEVVELQEKGRGSDGFMIDELPSGRLWNTKCFVESRKATETIWECLMDDDVRQIGVYGMGGVGKTTIMKHIHNQLLEEKGKFDTVYWVTVSKAFNVRKLQSHIAKALNLCFSDDEDGVIRASELYVALSRNKKYVLILDDLWEAVPLEIVGIPQPTRSNGCKIVLTTRSLDVGKRMGCTTVEVELLTEQEAMILFLKTATIDGMVLTPEVRSIAAEIAKECACLPLAIITIAGSLRGLKGTHEWRNALYELIGSKKEVDNGENEVLERLKFSYSHLGDKVLQDCFLYCSLYPKHHYIPVEELIEYWIAEGLIADMNSVAEKFNEGYAIVGKLTSSCLLESFTDEAGEDWLSIHDLIRDMALRITTSRPRFMVKAGERLERVPYKDWSEDLDKISFMYSQIRELPIRPPDCPRLTTLILSHIHVSEIPYCFFSNMRCLEVLDLSGNKIRRLPKSISNLERLHALMLVDCKDLRYVPSLEKLKALKVFILTQSLIEEVPEGMEALVNLRKLDLSNNKKLRGFPGLDLFRLQKLQYLSIDGTRVKVSDSDLLYLSELKVVAVSFNHQYGLHNYVSSQECEGLEKYRLLVGERISDRKLVGKDVCINLKSELFQSVVDHLVLPVNVDFFQLRGFDDPISLSVVRALKDARNLRKCDVSFCGGLESIFSSSSFSEDGQISLGTVESFFLSYLPSCRVLFDGVAPPRGTHFNLKELCFWKCDIMKNIFPVLLLQNFPNLGSLVVSECANVEDIIVEEEETCDWGNHQYDSNTISLPKLQILCLVGLPRLKSIYCGVMVCQSIEDVCVHNCPMLRRFPLSLHMDGEQATAPPFLKCIEVEESWWEFLQWDDPNTKAILQPFMNRGFRTRYELDLPTPDPKSREEKDSGRLQLQVHHYSDAAMSISNSESASCPASEGGELSMEYLADEVSHSSEDEILEEISLEKLEETPSDPQELEDLNCDPMEVPSTLSHHFSILHVLDLSYTQIKSLPQSISRLVALQKLFLRNCELLMKLPPEIGELTNLEVLDLEGTEILFLPKEIAKLVNLTCLKVSFYGYANQTVIPRRVLSNLSCLNELIIDVTPYGGWWDADVDAIMDDLCSLKELRTLKLYLPSADLLEELTLIFPGLTNFRFTVGDHEEHFITRLPQNVEEEFNNREKLEKGLKYINANRIPNAITKVLKHANCFVLRCHWTATSLSDFGHENMKELKFCLVMECNEFRTIIDCAKFGEGGSIVLQSLENLIIHYMKNMESIWKGPVEGGSLSNLKSLALHTCPKLTTLFPVDMLINLTNLEELIVEDCPKIESLVSLKNSGSKSGLFLRSLKKISLLGLPILVSISGGLRIAPNLERMVIFYCPKLEKLSSMEVSSTDLKVIKGEKEWWDALKWYESDLTTEHEDYLARLFIPLRRDGDLIAQLIED